MMKFVLKDIAVLKALFSVNQNQASGTKVGKNFLKIMHKITESSNALLMELLFLSPYVCHSILDIDIVDLLRLKQ